MRSQSTWRAVEQKQGPAGTGDHLGETPWLAEEGELLEGCKARPSGGLCARGD